MATARNDTGLRSGLGLCSCFARATNSGARSAYDFRPSHAFGTLSLVCRTGGNRPPSRARLFKAGGCSSAWAGSVDDLTGVAAQCCHSKRRPGVPRHNSAMARRTSRSSAKTGKACGECGLASLCGGAIGWHRRHSEWHGRVLEGRRLGGGKIGGGQRLETRADRSPTPVDFPDERPCALARAIYQALFVQGRGALRRELTACLRTGRPLRIPRARTRGRGKTFISSEIMISQRPAEAVDRAVPGHWEGDLILGLGSSAIGTLVERTNSIQSVAAPAAHAGPWPRRSREERPRPRWTWCRCGARRHHAHDNHLA